MRTLDLNSALLLPSLPLSTVLGSQEEMSYSSSRKDPSPYQFDMDLPPPSQDGGLPEELSKLGEPMIMERTEEEDSSQFSMSPQEQHDEDADLCLRMFESWTQARQTEFVEQLIDKMSFHQHEHIYSILMPMLQRDFITVLPSKYHPHS